MKKTAQSRHVRMFRTPDSGTGSAASARTLEEQMENALNFIWNELFLDSTNLIYDYTGSRDHAHRFDHLPQAEEIAAQFPNPCGWGTGMEDSMLHAGSMLPMLGLRKKTGGRADAREQAEKLLSGVELCTHVHGVPGFVVRSVSPRDGRSCYINSSMDQFTLCVYGCWSFLRDFPESPKAETARNILREIAAYCERVVQHDPAKNLRRLDGKQAVVSDLLGGLMCHKSMRLSMFYAAAYAADGDARWRDLYWQEARSGIEYALNPEPNRYWWDIEFSQMQLSLAVCAAVEQESGLLKKYREAMRQNALRTEQELRSILERAETFTGDWSGLETDWRKRSFTIREETIKNGSALFDGYFYLLPRHSADYERPNNILRALGNDWFTLLLTPEYRMPEELTARIKRILLLPDFTRHTLGSTAELLYGYWLARTAGQL